MRNIDKELIDWAIHKIKTEYPEDVALLIGQKGACKLPTDEQTMAFDFFVPATERGYQLTQTFIIEDMGYDLYPIDWNRLEGIVALNEPRMIFAFAKGEILYARNEEDRIHFENLKVRLENNLQNKELVFQKALEFLNTAMEIYQTMLFEESLCSIRKAAGGICCFLVNGMAMVNGRYLENGYANLTKEMKKIIDFPQDFLVYYDQLLHATKQREIKEICYHLLAIAREYFVLRKPEKENEKKEINYDDLALWYQEARYSFRKIPYYVEQHAVEDCYLLGCYLQIEFDAIIEDFELQPMDFLGSFCSDNLSIFAQCAGRLEEYIKEVLTKNGATRKEYGSLEEFLNQ